MIKQMFNSAIGDVDLTAKDVVGDVRWEIVAATGQWCQYKYTMLKNHTATVAGVSGDPVAYVAAANVVVGDLIPGSINNRVVLDMTDAAAQPVLAGFLTGTVTGTLDVAYYTWIQLTGPVTVPTAVTTGVLGSDFMMGTTDKTLVVATGVITSGGTLTSASGANNTVRANVAR